MVPECGTIYFILINFILSCGASCPIKHTDRPHQPYHIVHAHTLYDESPSTVLHKILTVGQTKDQAS